MRKKLREPIAAFVRKIREIFPRLPRMKPGRIWFWVYGIVPTMILMGSVFLWWSDPLLMIEFRSRVYDLFNRQWPRKYDPGVPVRIVDIDDESLSRIGQWPWPRTKVAELVVNLTNAGVAVIAFDVVFAEPDGTSPALYADSLPNTPKYRFTRDLLKTMGDNDKVFAEIIKQAPVVTGFSFGQQDNGVIPRSKATIFVDAIFAEMAQTVDILQTKRDKKQNFELNRDALVAYLPDYYDGAVDNIRELTVAAKGNGSFNALPDPDNIIRRVPMVLRHKQDIYPTLSLEAMRILLGGRGYELKASLFKAAGGRVTGVNGIGQISILKTREKAVLEIPTDLQGNVLLYDTGYRPERFIPAWKVLAGEVEPSLLEGAVAFVGTSAAGLKDQRGTPLNSTAAGVEVHAQIAEQIFKKEYLSRPAWARWAEGIFLILFGLAVIGLMSKLGAALGAVFAGTVIIGAFAGSWYAYTEKHFLVDPVYPALTVLAIYLSGSLINYLRSESEKKQVRGAFSRYMSPALVEQLAEDPSRLALGGEMRDMTLMFSDIRGFTTISEQFDAHGLTRFINTYLTPMTEIVLERRGTIDKYMGDCIMAFWNAPLDDKDHVRNACEAALVMSARLGELNEEWEVEAGEAGRKFIPIRAGIGLNTGECCVGNMGSNLRFDYSVLGDEVNLASRLEGQSKAYGVDIVLGAKTREVAKEFATVELDLIKVKGKTIPVHIYTLLGGKEEAEKDKFKNLAGKHAGMINAYRSQKWDEAEELMAQCRELYPYLNKFYDVYAERIEAYRADSPGPDWDGVFTATTK